MEENILHLMRRGAVTCTEDQSIHEVAQIMMVNRIHYCVVIGDQNRIKGIISARSILKAFGKNLDRTKARDILLPYTITVTQDTPLSEAVQVMAEKRIEDLIIVSGKSQSNVILGILSAEDIVRSMAEKQEGKA